MGLFAGGIALIVVGAMVAGFGLLTYNTGQAQYANCEFTNDCSYDFQRAVISNINFGIFEIAGGLVILMIGVMCIIKSRPKKVIRT